MLADRLGRKRPMSGRDLTELILEVPKNKQGRYRATASRVIPGKGIGPYRYHGVRSDVQTTLCLTNTDAICAASQLFPLGSDMTIRTL